MNWVPVVWCRVAARSRDRVRADDVEHVREARSAFAGRKGGHVAEDPKRPSPPEPSGSRPTGPPRSPWRRFRRLPLAGQVVSWLAAGLVVLGAAGAALGGKTSTQRTRRQGTSRAATTVTRSTGPPPRRTTTSKAARTTSITARAIPAAAKRTSPTAATAPGEPPRPTGACRSGDPLANVYHPYRLKVEDPCMTVTGTVAYVRHEDDGDVHVDLSLPATETHLLDQANDRDEDGELVTEIVPADQPGCTPGQPPPLPATAYRSPSYDYGVCTGADLATPPLGSEVSVTGPYVLDADHGWMELHPVWAITVISAPSTPPAPTRSAPPAPAAGPARPTGGASNAWCNANAVPSNDGYPGDYQVNVQSDQPDVKATASDNGDTWSEYTNGNGTADIRLYHTSAGMKITVTAGAASCSTTASRDGGRGGRRR